ncbi:integrator complex subunit 6-like [Ruditapes philippinarum]|uniref:integrator complex subunit 6-like n=1 Tax=Ruditapes philippinarum TaxID=129788 RepID=UPI00295BC06C|nr:integrator complex subunit 6-like [Ruditapes philippinarum]
MTIILFLVDTSASMNQRTYLGTSLIDIAKASVENFMKIRARDPNSRWDRYMLLTLEDPPSNIKAGWKENHATFTAELKNLTAAGITSMGNAMKSCFDLLNVNRMQSGIDTYGQGRCPHYLEPAVIITLTDGGKLTSFSGVQPELNIPMNTSCVPGHELTKEPFRWDQRIFGLVMRLPGSVPIDLSSNTFIPSADNHPLDLMCEVTGGRSYAVYNQKMLNAAIESLVSKVQNGVVIQFEKIGPDPPLLPNELNKLENESMKENQSMNGQIIKMEEEPKAAATPPPSHLPGNTSWHNLRRLILVPRSAQKGYSVGHWPIPESFWPDNTNQTLAPRSAHPNVQFSCNPCEPMVIDNLPFDKYELEPSPLTQYILERRQPNVCWQVFISNSARYSELGHPFGYIKASSTLSSVNLFVMPYNYPVLLPLLDELFKVHKLKPSPQWRQRFDNYIKTMPGYYAQPLKRALARMGAHNLVPENMDNCLSYSVITYLKKLKNMAKMEMDRLVASVGSKVPPHEGIKVSSRTKTSVLQRKDFSQLLKNVGGNLSSLKQELTDYNTFTIAVPDREIKPQQFRNPYDIPRKSLLDQIARMKTNFLQTSYTNKTKLSDTDELHSVPIGQMGNYQEYLKKIYSESPPLRQLENTPTRVHMFGNPFKVNKNIMVDEAEDSMLGGQQSQKKRNMDAAPGSPGPRKRKPGPLPKDTPIRRPKTPPVVPKVEKLELQPMSPIKEESDSEPESPSPKDFDMKPVIKEEPVEINHVYHSDSDTSFTNHVTELKNGRISPESPTNEKTVINNKHNNKLNHKKDLKVWNHNVSLRQLVVKEIRKPGRRYDTLFEHMNKVQGSYEIKCAFVQEIIHEAGRFKKKVLIDLLEKFERSLTQHSKTNDKFR